MITTRTRLLSILATVAMLVSMLACFIIPASADALSDYTEVLADISEGATNLDAEIAKGADATPESLKAAAQADATAGTIVWKTFNYKSEPYPSYALREAYEAAGYDKLESNRTQWSIASPADWRKMIADSTYDANGGTLFDGTQQLLFTDVVFHLYQNVDFDNQEMAPLCFGKTGGDNEKLGTFNGTINGHGFAFKNINVVATSTEGGKNFSSGMIGKLGYQATITAFGVDSGSVTGTSAANATKSIFMSLFGDPWVYSNKETGVTSTASLTRVWCGATITANRGEGAGGDAVAAGFLALARNAILTINGGYFFGALNGATSTVAMIFDNRYEKVYNSLSDTTATSMLAISNTTGACNYNRSVGSPVFGATTLTGDNATATSAAIGAYEINKLNDTAAAADGLDQIYYTWREDSLGNTVIRPLGNENNKIVKLTVNEKDEYINKGTELTKADLAAKAEIAEEDIVVIMVDGEDKSGETAFTVSGDTEITVAAAAIDWAGMLAAEVAKYDNLDAKYYTADSITAVTAFLDAAAAAQDETAIKAALEMAEALETTITTYATYPEEEGKEIPAFTMRDTFGAYNKNNVWAVKTTADWLAMVEASKVGDGKEANTFEGYTFHLFSDIDFADVEDPMDPLNYGTGAANDTSCVFNGTIEGHGYALKNIKVYVNCTSSSTNYVVGLIGKVGIKATINDFGVDSGTISADGSAKALYVATFGEPQTNGTDQPKLNRIWSGATITANAETASENANNYAVGIFASGQDSKVVINGAYFYGTVSAPNAFGIFDYVKNTPKIYNALSNATFAGTPTEFGMQRRSTTESHTYTIINNFSVGAPIHNQASLLEADATAGKITNSATVTSALEGAYEINKANLAAPAAEGAAKVYFTKVGDAIRFGTEDNRIVKVAVNEDDALYININQEYTKAELEAIFGKTILEVTAGENATYENDVLKVTGDAAIAVTFEEIPTCDHSANTNETYTKVDGEDKHVLLCSECGEATADAVDCDGTIVAGDVDMANGTSGHTMECAICHEIYTEECNGTEYSDPDSCKVAHEWRFACEVHEAAYVIEGTAKADHEFNGEWADVEGVENKKYKQCANCSTKIYQYVGVINALSVELAPVENGDIVINLPANLATADLKFTITGDYSIVNVAGAAAEGEIYKANASTVTVTVASTVASNGGTFKVEMTNAVATDDNPISDGTAMADITFKPCDHSRNENETYTKVDGEDKHVLLCSICGEATAEAEACAGTIVADSNIDADGNSKHTMKCDKCKADYEYACTATKYFDPADCRVAHEWKFDCEYHTGTYIIEGSAKADHEYNGEWADVEGVDDKQYKTCANCTSTIYQYVGDIVATDIELAPNTAENIVITLPSYLAAADLTFTIVGDYTITNVEGAIADGEIYKATATTVTVTISAAETATGGTFTVAMTNAADAEGIVIVDTSAQAAIAHIEVACPHANKTYVPVVGEEKHVLTCTDCSEAIAPAEACDGPIVADSNIDADGNSKHTMKCDKCNADYEYACTATKYSNDDDCTEDHKWMFACGVHDAEYVIADSGKDAHEFEGSEWNNVEGEANKQYRTCAYCSTKEYRYIGEVAAAGISLKPNAEGDIVITLPANVATADLTFTITGGYTIKNVEGAIADGDVYKATAATVTVSLNAASATAIGGTFKVEMTNAKATDDLAITDAAAEAEIALDGTAGDANGDNKLNLSDALSVLYVVAGKADASNINTANADMNNDGQILVADVYAIVSEWLKTRLANM